jgi:hypothetical protein
MFNVKVIADTESIDLDAHMTPKFGRVRLTTVELTYPLVVHAEFMTHRAFSRNAASARAIPTARVIKAVEENPFIPIHWGAAQKGMQAFEEVHPEVQEECRKDWLASRDHALDMARSLMKRGVHKQIANRLLAPFQWITVVASGTSDAWANFFHLRCHKMAEPHMQMLALTAREVYSTSRPELGPAGWWHLPYVTDVERTTHEDALFLAKVSASRCARISYLTRSDVRTISEDIALYERLVGGSRVHASALEHPAKVVRSQVNRPSWMRANFEPPWQQLRKMVPRDTITRMEDIGDFDDE